MFWALCPLSGEQYCLITHVVMPGRAGCGRVELGRKQCALCGSCYLTDNTTRHHHMHY